MASKKTGGKKDGFFVRNGQIHDRDTHPKVRQQMRAAEHRQVNMLGGAKEAWAKAHDLALKHGASDRDMESIIEQNKALNPNRPRLRNPNKANNQLEHHFNAAAGHLNKDHGSRAAAKKAAGAANRHAAELEKMGAHTEASAIRSQAKQVARHDAKQPLNIQRGKKGGAYTITKSGKKRYIKK